jgi:AraC family transcriptional regulator
MDSHLLETIERTTSYLEARLLEPVSLDDVSWNIGVSKFHLLRIWKGATSTGIMEYVRRRRLALSLSELLRRSHTIDFVASACAFGSERAYNRAFRDEFGMTPTRWRRDPCPLDILERFNARYLERRGDSLVGIQATRALPAFSVAGVEIRDRGEAPTPIRQGIDFFYRERRRIEKPVQRDVYLGLMSPRETGPRVYLPSIQIGPDSIVPPELTVRRVGPFSYGVFRYMGPHDPRDIDPSALGALWDHVLRSWKPTLGAASDAGTAFERIDFAKCSRQYCECDLYYPIRGLDEDADSSPGAIRGPSPQLRGDP